MDRTPASPELPVLRAEVVRPRPSARPWIVLAAAACLGPMMVLAPLLLLRPATPQPSPVHVVNVIQPPAPAIAPLAEPEPVVEEEPALPGQELSFVVSTEKASYMILEPASADIDRGPARLETADNYIDVVVSDLEAGALEPELAAWQGREVVVGAEPGTSCTTTVTGFALVGLLRGDLDYMARPDELSKKDIPEFYLGQTTPHVAAVLGGCAGRYARLASLPAAIEPVEITDDGFGAAARAALFRSDLARAAQGSYDEIHADGAFHEDQWGEISTRVVRDPDSGATLAIVHVVIDYGCGGANINLLGVYRKAAGGEPVAVMTRDLGEVTGIDRLIDVDRDGGFELIGDTWLDGPVLLDASGETQFALPVPFFGCPC
jgi:hypothetical protein